MDDARNRGKTPLLFLLVLLFGKQKVPKRVSDTLLSAVLFRFSGDYSCQHWFLHTTKKFPASQGFSVHFRLLLLGKSGNTYHFIIEIRQVPVKFRLRNNKTPSTQFFCSIYEGSKGELTDSRKGLFFDEFPSSSPPSQSSFSENFLRNCPILIPPLLTSCAVENKGKAIVVLKHHYLI